MKIIEIKDVGRKFTVFDFETGQVETGQTFAEACWMLHYPNLLAFKLYGGSNGHVAAFARHLANDSYKDNPFKEVGSFLNIRDFFTFFYARASKGYFGSVIMMFDEHYQEYIKKPWLIKYSQEPLPWWDKIGPPNIPSYDEYAHLDGEMAKSFDPILGLPCKPGQQSYWREAD